MYSTSVSSAARTDQLDSKYTVADILSSMANGEPVSSSYGPSVNFASSVLSSTTPTLTPTTLSNIEQTFIELQSVPTTVQQERHMQSGFVPPLVDPHYSDSASQDDDSDWAPSTRDSKRLKTGRSSILNEEDIYTPGYLSTNRRPPTRKKDDKLSQDEIDRRRVRRERNKLAAAKCRQRRVDHTNRLMDETDQLEDQKTNLENEIQSLQQQKEQLEFLLQAHKPLCKMNHLNDSSNIGVVGSSASQHQLKIHDIERSIKVEPMEPPAHSCRPTSLPIKTFDAPVTCSELGITMTTPSNGIFTFGLDSMVGDHTGLTPIMSCASQVQRSSSDSSPGDQLNSPTLISL